MTSVMSGPFPETDASNPTYVLYHLTTDTVTLKATQPTQIQSHIYL